MAIVRVRKWGGPKDKEAKFWGPKEGKRAWQVDYVDRAGKRRIKQFKTQNAARAYKIKVEGELAAGVHTADAASITVEEAAGLWLRQCEADGLERSTTIKYANHIKLCINPLLKYKKLSQLTSPLVARFADDLRDKGKSKAMVKKALTSLGALIGEAQRRGPVNRNVVKESGEGRRSRHQKQAKRNKRRLVAGVDFPTKDELKAIIAGAAGRWRPLLITAIFTGLRASELRGLRWADVDMEKRTLTVRQRADQWKAIGAPKSEAGEREIPLTPMVVNAMKEWKLACPKGELGLVFPTETGGVLDHHNMVRRGFEALQARLGIVADSGKKDKEGEAIKEPKYGMHALRHAAASLFIEEGFTPKRLMDLMGHSSIQMTYDTYGHLFPSPDDDQKAMERMQARLLA